MFLEILLALYFITAFGLLFKKLATLIKKNSERSDLVVPNEPETVFNEPETVFNEPENVTFTNLCLDIHFKILDYLSYSEIDNLYQNNCVKPVICEYVESRDIEVPFTMYSISYFHDKKLTMAQCNGKNGHRDSRFNELISESPYTITEIYALLYLNSNILEYGCSLEMQDFIGPFVKLTDSPRKSYQSTVASYAAKSPQSCNIRLLEWVVSDLGCELNGKYMVHAYSNSADNVIEVIEWLEGKGCRSLSPGKIFEALRYNDGDHVITMLERMTENVPAPARFNNNYIMKYIIKIRTKNTIPILNWLVSKGCYFDHEDLFEEAIKTQADTKTKMKVHLQVLDFLWEHECPYYDNIFEMAAENRCTDRIQVFDWLISHGIPYDSSIFSTVIKSGKKSWPIIKWMHKNNFPIDEAAIWQVINKLPTKLEWFMDNYQLCTLGLKARPVATLEELMEYTLIQRHCSVIEYLHKKKYPFTDENIEYFMSNITNSKFKEKMEELFVN